MRLSKKRATSELGSNGHAVHPREGLPSETRASGLRCAEASNALIRVHKASTQNQNLRSKTSKISMSERDNRKSCHSDQYLADPQIPFPTVSPTDIRFYVFVLHDAAEGAMRTTARVRRQTTFLQFRFVVADFGQSLSIRRHSETDVGTIKARRSSAVGGWADTLAATSVSDFILSIGP